ncbi:MAG: uncharacterized protein KVP18_004029 [Porospora cf. gigantea A]|uniref:uncharacterized protein n=1 Tax=Porospora cf. gigantea A TaxID=2853593 RepID=UPI003559552A|nr:MAG: hypothetical protein KVP18_004029 [Porospora cf. gigantea A]
MGYSAPCKPERDGEWTVQGDHIVVSKAPAKPVGCTANVQMPEGKTYNWKEFFTMYGKAKLAGFMANSSKETSGGWASEGYSGWGWCFGFEIGHPSGNYGNQDNLSNNTTCAAWGNLAATLTSSFKEASVPFRPVVLDVP